VYLCIKLSYLVRLGRPRAHRTFFVYSDIRVPPANITFWTRKAVPKATLVVVLVVIIVVPLRIS